MWTVTFNVLTALSLLGSLVAIYLAARSAAHASESLRLWQGFKPLHAESLSQRLSECESTLSLLANKVKMMRVRSAVTHLDRDKGGEPDAKSDPERWRAWKNAQLRAGEFNS